MYKYTHVKPQATCKHKMYRRLHCGPGKVKKEKKANRERKN